MKTNNVRKAVFKFDKATANKIFYARTTSYESILLSKELNLETSCFSFVLYEKKMDELLKINKEVEIYRFRNRDKKGKTTSLSASPIDFFELGDEPYQTFELQCPL